MNFLNPAVLFALAAAALPLVIHLLSRRRAKDVAWPSIEFLERMRAERMRRLRLKQLLLILVRTLIVVLIVLAFARPAVNSAFHRNARTSAVIVLDSSASMGYVHNGEVVYSTAVRKAGDILGMLGKNDTAAVILSGDEPRVLGSGGLSADKEKIAEILDEPNRPRGTGAPEKAFVRALDMLTRSGDPNRELYYVTDAAENALPDSLPTVDGPVRLYVVRVGPGTREGSVIDELSMKDRLLTAGGPVTFSARCLFGSGDERGADVEFFVNGERKGRVAVVRGATPSAEAEFSYIPETPGWYSVSAVVMDGRFEAGETRRLVMHVPRKASVLLAGGGPGDIYFLEKALDPDPERSMFTIRRVLNGGFTGADISGSDVVVLSGVSTLPEGLYRSLVTAVVEQGTGLIVFPPRDMGESLYADGIFRDLIPVEVENRVTLDGTAGTFARIDWFDMSHPVFRGVVEGEGAFTKPVVTSFLRMRPVGKVSVIARFSDNSMAAGEAVCGNGRVVLFAVDSSRRDSELPLTGIFIPLFIRTVQHLAGVKITGGRYETGEPVTEFLGGVPENTPVRLTPEDGPVRSVEIEHEENGARVSGLRAEAPGFYSLFAGEGERTRFCVNAPRGEIVFSRAGAERTAEAFKGIRHAVIDDGDDIAEFVTNDRFGRELFGLFMLAAFALIAVEMVLSRRA